MTLRVLYDPTARAEADEAHDLYEAERPGLGQRFQRALADAEQLANSQPGAGSPLAGGRRRVIIDGFPYSLVYRVDAQRGAVLVVAIAHHKRRPGYWRARRGE